MATKFHNLSSYDPTTVPQAGDMTFGIVVSEWNGDVTSALLNGAVDALVENGAKTENIHVMTVPGSFELIYGSAQMVKTQVDAVIAIGCVVRGDTPHFDYICEGTTNGLSHLNATQDIPVIYGLITVNEYQQALDRCGGKMGSKGCECAITAIKMVDYKRKLNTQPL